MSAVIVNFPLNAGHQGERVRVVLAAVNERAKATNATAQQKRLARADALDSLHRGDSAGAAIQCGYKQLPSLRLPAYRQPTYPNGPTAA